MTDDRLPERYEDRRYLTEQPTSRTRFYRDKRNGKVNGICAGIADLKAAESVDAELEAMKAALKARGK